MNVAVLANNWTGQTLIQSLFFILKSKSSSQAWFLPFSSGTVSLPLFLSFFLTAAPIPPVSHTLFCAAPLPLLTNSHYATDFPPSLASSSPRETHFENRTKNPDYSLLIVSAFSYFYSYNSSSPLPVAALTAPRIVLPVFATSVLNPSPHHSPSGICIAE